MVHNKVLLISMDRSNLINLESKLAFVHKAKHDYADQARLLS